MGRAEQRLDASNETCKPASWQVLLEDQMRLRTVDTVNAPQIADRPGLRRRQEAANADLVGAAQMEQSRQQQSHFVIHLIGDTAGDVASTTDLARHSTDIVIQRRERGDKAFSGCDRQGRRETDVVVGLGLEAHVNESGKLGRQITARDLLRSDSVKRHGLDFCEVQTNDRIDGALHGGTSNQDSIPRP